jgi:hypothetical protein
MLKWVLVLPALFFLSSSASDPFVSSPLLSVLFVPCSVNSNLHDNRFVLQTVGR